MSSISASLPSFPSLDPTYCAHTNDNGKQCICRRCKTTRLTDDGAEVCTSCGHIESAHPDIIESKPPLPAPGIILQSYLDAGRHASKITASSASKQLQGVKASKEEAREETSAGLKKRKSDTDTAPPSKKAKGKLKATVKSRDVVVHKVFLLTDGIKNGTLNKITVPSKLAANELKSHHLVILTTPAKPIVISNGWDNKRANQEVASLFHIPFKYITEASPDETQHWVSLIAQNKTLHIAADEFPMGADLIDNCSRSASGNLVLYLATKIKIPLSRQQNWEAPLSEPESDELGSDELGSDIQTLPSEDIIRSPIKTVRPKPRPIVKNVKKEVKTKVMENQSDMKEAATRRITRLADGSKKRTPTIHIPTSSDDEYDYTPMVDEDQKPVINVDELPDLPQDIPIDKEFPLFLTSRTLSPINDDKPKSPSPDFDFNQYDSPPGSPIPTTAVATSIATSSSTNNVFTSGLGSSSSTASSSLAELPHIPSSYAAPSWSMASWMTSVPQPLPFTPPELNNMPVEELPAPDIPNRFTEAGPQRFRKMGRGRAGQDPWAAPK